MSTHPQSATDTEPRQTAETADQFASEAAPRTFDPHNTRSRPDPFDDRWRDTSDGLEHR